MKQNPSQLFTSHPVHCVPLLTPAIFGFQNERKRFKGNALFLIQALPHGINSNTLYAMLQQNPSSKLNSKPHYSSQPMDQTPKCLLFSLPIVPPPNPHLHLTATQPPPHRHFLLTCLYRCVRAARLPVRMRAHVCVCVYMCVCAMK